MPASGPIVIVENDLEDQEVLAHMLESIGVKNELRFFDNGKLALDYLRTMSRQPFLILCDINMPLMNGLELREQICNNAYLREKSIPFIFLTTSSNYRDIKKAYELTVQGYFKKQDTYGALKKDLEDIIAYWSKCKHPNNGNL